MNSRNFDTRAALLKCGKQEFLERGFKGASLRTICRQSHVTTGAFYAHFKSKEDLFAEIVEDDLGDYLELYDGLLARLAAKAQKEGDNEVAIMEYLLDHCDLFRLLFDCSEGTRYEGFKEQLIRRFESSYQTFFEAYADDSVDHDLTKIIVQMKFAQYCSQLFGGRSRSYQEVRSIRRVSHCAVHALRHRVVTWASMPAALNRGM